VAPGLDIFLDVVDSGVFHGSAATISVRCDEPLHEESVRKRLRAEPGMRLLRRNQPARPSDAVELREVLCANLRVDGPWVSAWLASDGLRTVAPRAVLEIFGAATAS
jgi:aspartate-semialdehyde dehydrogenase